MKILFGMALRQTTGFVDSLLCLIGLDWDVPVFSMLSRRQKTLAVNIPHRGSQGPLHADGLMPVLDGQLAGDNCGGAAMTVFEDFQEVAALGGGQDGEAPIVDYQHIHAGDGL
jgi:hypothetical protein